MDLCRQSNVPAFNMLSRLVIAFLPRNKHLLISWLQSPFAVILEPKCPISSVHMPSMFQFQMLHVAAAAKSLQSCPTLCDPIDGSPPDSPVPGILQARTLEWVAEARSRLCVCRASGSQRVAISFSSAWKWKVKVKSQSCPTLRDPMDCSLPGSSVHGVFQAEVLEWGVIAFSEMLHKSD